MSSLATLQLRSPSFHPTAGSYAGPAVVPPSAPPVRTLARKVEALRSLPLFLGAPEVELRRLAESALLRNFQRELLLRTLKETGGNVSEVARRLDLVRSHVYAMMKAFGIEKT